MESVTRALPEPVMLRANRKVIAARCSVCNKGFKLAEETYSCPYCSGYHHAACWRTYHACTSQNGVPATTSGVENQTPINETPITIAPVPHIAEGERRCPNCAKAIRSEALKCRFCGHLFDQEYAQTVEQIPRELASEIESYATQSLTKSILGLFFCAPILGPMAISNGRDARRLLDDYPSYRTQTSAGGRALAGIIIGVIELVIFVLGFFSMLGGGR